MGEYRSSSVLRFLCASPEMLGWGAEEKTEVSARTDPPRVGRCLRNMAASSKRIGSETKMMCAAGPAGMSAGRPARRRSGTAATSTPSAFVGTRAHGRPVKRACTSCTRSARRRAEPQLRAGRNLVGYSPIRSLPSNSRFVALMWRWGCMACPPPPRGVGAVSFFPRWARKPRASARGLAREDGREDRRRSSERRVILAQRARRTPARGTSPTVGTFQTLQVGQATTPSVQTDDDRNYDT